MQVADGLAAAHAQGLVHRDVKPANILLENGVERVKITDFGLARAIDDASLTHSGYLAGTPQYMAPEQARGEAVDHRADLFSLGSVLYAMCTGHSPFRADTTLAILRRLCEDTPRPVSEVNPDVPDWLTEIIEKLHAKDRQQRFQSASEVAELFGKYLAHLQQPKIAPKPPRLGYRSATAQATRRRWLRRIVAAATIMLLTGLVFAATGPLAFQGTSSTGRWRGVHSGSRLARVRGPRDGSRLGGRTIDCGRVGSADARNRANVRTVIRLGGADAFCSRCPYQCGGPAVLGSSDSAPATGA